MQLARVIGEVWATKKCPGLQGKKLLLLAIQKTGDDGRPLAGERVVVAADILDARIGETVIVTVGSGARNVFKPGAGQNYDVMIDCAVQTIIDDIHMTT